MKKTDDVFTKDSNAPFVGALALADFILDPPKWDEDDIAKLDDFDEDFITDILNEPETDLDVPEIIEKLHDVATSGDWCDWIDWFENEYPAMNLDALCALQDSIKAYRNALLDGDLSPLAFLIQELVEAVEDQNEEISQLLCVTNPPVEILISQAKGIVP